LTIISPFFAFRVDIWDDTGDGIVEHVAGVDDFEVAEATYRAAAPAGAHYPATGHPASPRKEALQLRSGTSNVPSQTPNICSSKPFRRPQSQLWCHAPDCLRPCVSPQMDECEEYQRQKSAES
jgi:hypothetical protein